VSDLPLPKLPYTPFEYDTPVKFVVHGNICVNISTEGEPTTAEYKVIVTLVDKAVATLVEREDNNELL
jgi:hypothetical protein